MSENIFEKPKDLECKDDITLFRYMHASDLYHLLRRQKYYLTSIQYFGGNSKELPTLRNLLANICSNPIGLDLACNIYKASSFSSSWIESRHETVDMWKIYTEPTTGVVIKTTAKKLIQSLDLSPIILSDNIARDTLIKRIEYITNSDIDSTKLLSASNSEQILPVSHFYKHKSFENENEIRIGYLAITIDELKFFMQLQSEEDTMGIMRSINNKLENLKADSVSIDYTDSFSNMIEEIRVSPFSYPRFKTDVYWTVKAINEHRLKTTGKNFLGIKVKNSEIEL